MSGAVLKLEPRQTAIDWQTEKTSARIKLLDHLRDRFVTSDPWVANWELEQRFGQRFNSRIGELRALGYRFEARWLTLERVEELGRKGRGPRGAVKGKANGKEWRLVSIIPGPPPPRKARRVRLYLEEADARALLEGEVTDLAKSAAAKALDTRASQDGLRSKGNP